MMSKCSARRWVNVVNSLLGSHKSSDEDMVVLGDVITEGKKTRRKRGKEERGRGERTDREWCLPLMRKEGRVGCAKVS